MKIQIPLLAAFGCLFTATLQAQSVPGLINYQGRLTDHTGSPMPPAMYSVQFRLWDAQGTNANLVWGEQDPVNVFTNGVFNVILGAGAAVANATPITNTLAGAFAGSNRFLGVTIVSQNGNPISNATEVAPRQQLLSVPYAMNANWAVNAVSANNANTASVASVASSVANGSVGLTNLAPRLVTTNSLAPAGGIAVSLSSGPGHANEGNLSVTLVTTGRPVIVSLVPDGQNASELGVFQGSAQLVLQLNGAPVHTTYTSSTTEVPSCTFFDIPPAGTNTYNVLLSSRSADAGIYQMVLVAYEL